MINREHDLPITKQAQVLRISRGSVYYLTRPMPEADLAIMRRLDRLHLEFPFAGSRMLQGLLVAEGCKIGRRHVKTLMQRMGIEALYRRPRTTKPEPGHKIYPYLLRGAAITRPNQVWAMDITYIPMARGFVYLAVVLDQGLAKTAHNRRENEAALVAYPPKIVIVLIESGPRSRSVGLKSQPIAPVPPLFRGL